jgi:hypothetical protein
VKIWLSSSHLASIILNTINLQTILYKIDLRTPSKVWPRLSLKVNKLATVHFEYFVIIGITSTYIH